MRSWRKQINQFTQSLNGPIVLIGASVRQLAHLIQPLDVKCIGIDFYGDWDTSGMVPVTVINRYTDAAQKTLKLDLGGLIYTGGLENYPTVVSQFGDRTKVLGCCPDSLKAAKNPFALQELFSKIPNNAVRFPDIFKELNRQESLKDWILKPIRSTGGNKVRVADQWTPCAGQYFQRKISGQPHAALFVAGAKSTRLLGVSHQLTGHEDGREPSFRYSGSIGPVDLPNKHRDALLTAATFIATELKFCGVFGIDFSIDHDAIWAYDVNPRITASAEILQRTLYQDTPGLIAATHLGAFIENQPLLEIVPHFGKLFAGKKILFNQTTDQIEISKNKHARLANHVTEPATTGVWLTDVPGEGTKIQPGHPILTVQTSQPDMNHVHSTLRYGTEMVLQLLQQKPNMDT